MSESAGTARWSRVGTLMTGQSVSLVGDSMLQLALAWSAVQLGGAGAVTALTLASTVPKVLMLLFGGAVADALGPRVVLLRTSAGRMTLIGVGAVAVLYAETLPTLMIIAAVEGVLLGIGGPSFGSVLPRLASGSALSRANSLYSMVTRLAPIVGAPLGAWLIATQPLWAVMALVAALCTLSLACLVHVTRGMSSVPAVRSGEGLLRRAGDGVRLLAGHRELRWLFVGAFVLDFAFGWPVIAALPVLADERGWGVQAVGTVIAAFSAGALASAGLGALLGDRLPMTVRLVASGVVLASALLVMGLMGGVTGLAVAAFVAGTASGFNGPAIVTLYQRAAPADRMGAAMATLALAGIGTTPFSVAVFGGLALLLGVQTTWVLCGLVAFGGPLAAILALRAGTAEVPEVEERTLVSAE